MSVNIVHTSTVQNDVMGQVLPVICKLFPVARAKFTVAAEAMSAPAACLTTQENLTIKFIE